MIINATNNPALDAAVAHRAAGSRQHDGFAQALASQGGAGIDRDAQIREAAEQLVATTFILPLLQQIRSDPFKSDLFHGGFAEDAFGQQLDTILADRIAQRTGGPGTSIADAVYRSINRQVNKGFDVHG
jgi:Rod binding domain-containing protein